MEWTPTSIKYYLNGSLKRTTANNNNHGPMGVILNLAIDGCFDFTCGTPKCVKNGSTIFPNKFEIDYIRTYQLENQAIYFKGIKSNICVNETMKILTPVFPNASYNWSSSSPNLQITPSPWLDLTGGIWKSADLKGLIAGYYIATLTINFPSGYTESKTFLVSVLASAPQQPVDIVFTPNYQAQNCCYFATMPQPTAYIYDWNINGSLFTTTSNNTGNFCIPPGYTTASVVIGNSCGNANPFYKTTTLSTIPGCSNFFQINLSPNPTKTSVNYELTKINSTEFIDPEEFEIKINDAFGKVKLLEKKSVNKGRIALINYNPGVYYIFFKSKVNPNKVESKTFIVE